jgi:excisionase family DNA binding protein
METTTDIHTLAATAPDTAAATLLLTLDEAARELRCARRSIERQVAGHCLAVVHVGRSVRVERSELERFIAQRRELRDAVRELEHRRDIRGHARIQGDPTLGDWIEHWLDAILPMTARWKTLSTYRSQMRLHVVPVLGSWRMSEIQPEHLEEHYCRMLADGLSPHTIHAVHRVLRSALNEAVRRHRLVANPALIARPPRREDVEVEPLSIEESRRVLLAARKTVHPARWSMALSLGLRQGEALGLLWGDVDLDDGVLRIRRSVQRHTWKHGCEVSANTPSCGRKRGAECPRRAGGGLQLVEPKTTASKRTIVLPRPLIEELRAHRAAVNRRRLAAGESWDGSCDLVFPTEQGGLMSIMGWTEMATAQRYTHAVDELRRRAAHEIGILLWRDETHG